MGQDQPKLSSTERKKVGDSVDWVVSESVRQGSIDGLPEHIVIASVSVLANYRKESMKDNIMSVAKEKEDEPHDTEPGLLR